MENKNNVLDLLDYMAERIMTEQQIAAFINQDGTEWMVWEDTDNNLIYLDPIIDLVPLLRTRKLNPITTLEQLREDLEERGIVPVQALPYRQGTGQRLILDHKLLRQILEGII